MCSQYILELIIKVMLLCIFITENIFLEKEQSHLILNFIEAVKVNTSK